MIKILGCADLHLGKKISGAGTKAANFREQLFLTSEKIITELAPENNADIIVICGDLFDRPEASWNLIERTATMLSKSKIPIHIISGNHDALEGSKNTALWNLKTQLGPNSVVHIHTERAEYKIDDLNCTIYPGVLNSRFDNSDQTAWIPKRKKKDGVRIGLFHGSIANIGGDEPRMKNIDSSVALNQDLDIALLGDWHGPRSEISKSMINQPDKRLWYTGAPEAQIRSQNWTGRILICEVEPQKEPIVSEYKIGKNKFRDIDVYFQEESPDSGFSDIDQVFADILKDDNNELTAWRIIATGWITKNNHDDLISKVEELKNQFSNLAFKDKIVIVSEKIIDSSGIIDQISNKIVNSEEQQEVQQKALRLLSKYFKQVGGMN